MAKHFVIVALLLSTISFTAIAQQQGALSRFIVGTDPLNFTMATTTNQIQYTGVNIPVTSSNKSTTIDISAHINLFVGYFVTKNICTGLQFGKNTILSPFIRYYLFRKNPDSSKVDFFLQANFTFDYNSLSHPDQENAYGNGYSDMTPYSINTTLFNFGVGAAIAWHFNRHWSLEGEIGYVRENSVISTDSYTITTVQIDPVRGIRTISSSVSPGTKNTSLTNEGVLRLMLSYRL